MFIPPEELEEMRKQIEEDKLKIILFYQDFIMPQIEKVNDLNRSNSLFGFHLWNLSGPYQRAEAVKSLENEILNKLQKKYDQMINDLFNKYPDYFY